MPVSVYSFPAIDHMVYREDRMAGKHPRARVPHDLPDVLSSRFVVAVDLAVQTRGFVLQLRTVVNLLKCIVQQPLTCTAKIRSPSMHTMAVEFNHDLDGMFFPVRPGRFSRQMNHIRSSIRA